MNTARVTAAAFCCMLFLHIGTLQAQTSQKITFSTFTPTGHTNLLLGNGPRAEIKAEATLRLPSSDSKRHPVIVVVPGQGGHVEEHFAFWQSRLLSSGFGVLAIDPLRIRNLARDQGERLSTAADMVDVFRVLKSLTANPHVDPERVAILGFSRGGLVAWDTQADAFMAAILGASPGIRFAAHAALYPPCHYAQVERRRVHVPTLLVLAGADAWTPPEHCQSLVKAASDFGYGTKVTVVEGAQHAFDYFMPVSQDSNAMSSKGCRPLLVNTATPYPRPVHHDDGSLLVAGEGPAPVAQILDWGRQCRRQTTAPIGNQRPAEREEAALTVIAFFTQTLKP